MHDKTKRESSQTRSAAAPLRQLQTKAEELATLQRNLKQQLDAALKKAHELHQKMVEQKSDLGGEGWARLNSGSVAIGQSVFGPIEETQI